MTPPPQPDATSAARSDQQHPEDREMDWQDTPLQRESLRPAQINTHLLGHWLPPIIGAMAASPTGVAAIALTGGIGAHNAALRQELAAGLA